MISLKNVISIGLMVIAVVNLSSCNKNYGGANDSAFVQFMTPQIFATKQILVVEGYNSLECPFKRNLNSGHEKYAGRLLYNHSQRNSNSEHMIRVKANKPLTLAVTLSQVSGVDDSSICYYRYYAFTPIAEAKYQVRLSEDCSLKVYQAESNANSELEYILQKTEKPKCR